MLSRLLSALGLRGARRPMDRIRLGRWGERQAVRLLRREGMRVLTRNFRCDKGEIDIVAGDGRTVVFVEVKTRQSLAYGAPESAVDERKRRHIRAVAARYLSRFRRLDDELTCRFDIVAIDCSRPDAPPVASHIRDAFSWKRRSGGVLETL